MSAVIAVKRKRLVRRFYEIGAIDPEHAIDFESLGECRTWIFDQMLGYGVFSTTSDGRYFMNVERASEFLRACRFRALSIGGFLLILFLVMWLAWLLSR